MQPQFFYGNEMLGKRQPLILHQWAEPVQFVTQRDRRFECGTVGPVHFIPPGGELGDKIPPHGYQPFPAADRRAQAVCRREVCKGKPRRKVHLPAERLKEQFPQIEREPLVQRHDEELFRIAPRLL